MILQRNRKMYCPLCRRIKLVGIINPPLLYIYARTDQHCMYFVHLHVFLEYTEQSCSV